MDKKDRLKELQSKEQLTDSEMEELKRISPAGTFKKLPVKLQELGVIDLDQAVENFKEGPERTRRAMSNECYLEVISLRLQHAEFWLRIFWVVKNKAGKIFDPNDRRTFGMILDDCARLDLPEQLVVRLRDFNLQRVTAIHKYILGATSYLDLKRVCLESEGLDGSLGEYVRAVTGIPLE